MLFRIPLWGDRRGETQKYFQEIGGHEVVHACGGHSSRIEVEEITVVLELKIISLFHVIFSNIVYRKIYTGDDADFLCEDYL